MAKRPVQHSPLTAAGRRTQKKSNGGGVFVALLALAAVGIGGYYYYDQSQKQEKISAVKKVKKKKKASVKKDIAQAKPAVASAAAAETQNEKPIVSADVSSDEPNVGIKPAARQTFPPPTRYDRAPKAVCYLPKDIAAKLDSGDYQAVYDALVKSLKGKKPDIKNDEYMHSAMLTELIRCTGAEVMTELAGDKKKAKFLEAFCKDSAWLEFYLGGGLVPYQTPVGLDVLYRIWQEEDGKVKNKALAVALASLWGGGETSPQQPLTKMNPDRFNPVWRYKFFLKQEQENKLHPNYPKLRPWELRFVVGIAGQDWDDKSFEWAAENINMPWDQYHSACWAATYTDPSRFGDSVQGGAYNMPYSVMSDAETTHRNGGVCGALSHLGCFAAMAHGIPATTVGQPGHCAYGYRLERGKWVGGFGGPDGGMHNQIFGHRAPTSYTLMETVFGDDKGVATAYRKSYAARALEAAGDSAGAIDMWQSALKDSPLHPFFRKELHRLMKDADTSANSWHEYLMATIPLYVENGFAAVDMTADLEQEIAAMNDAQKIDIYSAMHTMIAGSKSSWAVKCTDIIKNQTATLSENMQETYLTRVFGIHMHAGDGTVFGQVLEWAVAEFCGGEKEAIFSRAFAVAAEKAPTSGSGEADAEKSKRMMAAYNKAIVAAEQSRSAPAFQSLIQAAKKSGASSTAPVQLNSLAAMQGKAAKAALFRISTSAQWDTPTTHLDITTPDGGKCHTNKEEKPHFIIELPNASTVTGCIVRKTDGNEGRMKKATVYTSSDGATWMPKESTDNMPKEWAVNFPAGTSAKWVKVEFENKSPDFAHISHFVVFTR